MQRGPNFRSESLGPDRQSYRGALLFASAEGAPGDLTIAAIRFNDSRVGPAARFRIAPRSSWLRGDLFPKAPLPDRELFTQEKAFEFVSSVA